ncbi:MAG TPA: ribosome recycling factor [Candidatus Binatia bacterium]|nr:ribosome recycling factor [Candidatus Binatia bacterium]
MIEDIKKKSAERMKKSIDALKQEFTKLRTGRASAGLVEPIRVEYYGSPVPLSQVASVVVEDARTISITPWEKTMVQPIEKAILASGLGITPNTAGTAIRLVMPPLTEERRKELVKLAHKTAEHARVAVRNVRRDGMETLKTMEKDHKITEDEHRKRSAEIQKATDEFVKSIDDTLAAKEKETMHV